MATDGMMTLDTLTQTELEKALLGSMLRCNDAIDDVTQIVRREDFRTAAHQFLFRAIADLHDQGKPADLATVATLLSERQQLADVRPAYIAELWEAEPSGSNAVTYAEMVRDNATLRGLSVAGRCIADDADKRAGSPQDILERAERRIFDIADRRLRFSVVPLREIVSETFERLDERMSGSGGDGSVPTGLADLDRLTGGMRPGELVILAARPSIGKTSMALGIAHHNAAHGNPVLFVSLEQSRLELGERLLAMEARVDSLKVRKAAASNADMAALAEAGDRLRRMPLFIDDHAVQGCLRIGANARRLRLREGVKLLVVDYLQLIEPEQTGRRSETRQEQVAAISRRLKQLARELSIPVVALAQLNRGVEGRVDQTPRLSDLRESGAIEADADAVWLLHRHPDNESLVSVHVAKQRNGPTGEVVVVFNGRSMRFENHAAGTPCF